ncbi:MAG: adenosine deaminase, partial [Nitratireductor sp.]
MIAKAELHCHIEGTVDPKLVLEQAKLYDVDTSSYVDPKAGYLWTDFPSFLQSYDFVASLFRTPEDYTRLTQNYFDHLSDDGAIYAELFVSPDHAVRIGCSYSTLIEAIAEGMKMAKDKTGIEGRIIVVGVRHSGVEAVENAARLTAQNPHEMVTGFGMAGNETFGQVKDFATAFKIAKDAGLQLTTHAGEFCGAQSVADSLDYLHVERIGHGVRAIEDPNLVKRLADEKITLEVCPGSNIALNVYEDLNAHPLRLLEEAGCDVTLNSDDPPHFHTSLKNEYMLAKDQFGYNDEALLGFTKNAIKAA